MDLRRISIWSGGQTGADRTALDWAIANEVPHAGWCPKGRLAEDGPIPPCYQLKETPRKDYLQRTEWNVRDNDATMIFTVGRELAGDHRRPGGDVVPILERRPQRGEPGEHQRGDAQARAGRLVSRCLHRGSAIQPTRHLLRHGGQAFAPPGCLLNQVQHIGTHERPHEFRELVAPALHGAA